LFCHKNIKQRFYTFHLEPIGFNVDYFQKGGLLDKVRKTIYVLNKIDEKPTMYSIFAKVETGVLGSEMDNHMKELQEVFDAGMERPDQMGTKMYVGKTYDVYCHMTERYLGKVCVDFHWKQANSKWNPKRYSARGLSVPAESSVDEVRSFAISKETIKSLALVSEITNTFKFHNFF
jgi:hypothetical protein